MSKRLLESEFIDEDQQVVISTSILWKIHGFSKRYRTRAYLKSGCFWSEEDKSTIWKLLVYTNGFTLEEEGFLSIFLVPIAYDRIPYATYRFFLLDDAGRMHKKSKKTSLFEFVNEGVGIGKWFRIQHLKPSGLLKNDTLIIRGEVDLIIFKKKLKNNNKRLKTDIGGPIHPLPNKWLNSDIITLICENKAIYVHKHVIEDKSPVIHATLTTDMLENSTTELVISDMKFEVLNDLLLFCYTGAVPKFNGNTQALIIAADYYLIPELKLKLEEVLIDNISSDNYADLFSFSNVYSLQGATKAILRFIKENCEELSK